MEKVNIKNLNKIINGEALGFIIIPPLVLIIAAISHGIKDGIMQFNTFNGKIILFICIILCFILYFVYTKIKKLYDDDENNNNIGKNKNNLNEEKNNIDNNKKIEKDNKNNNINKEKEKEEEKEEEIINIKS